MSIAGNRRGLEGERSGLFRKAIDLVRAMQKRTNNQYPRFFVWENVPGAFSSNKGFDFRTVLEEITAGKIPMPKSNRWAKSGMVGVNGCEVAWRVLDAQYWGVPQRRKRIFLVADFAGQCAGEILFKCKSLPGNTSQGEGAGQDAARDAGKCINTAGFKPNNSAQSDIACQDCLRTTVVRMRGGCEGGGKGALVSVEKSLTLAANTNDQTLFQPILKTQSSGEGTVTNVSFWDMTHADEVMREVKGGKVQTLNARMGTGGNQIPVVLNETYCIAGNTINRNNGNGGNGAGFNTELSYTLNTMDRHAVAYGQADYSSYRENDITTLKASGGSLSGGSENLVYDYKVRKLTPLECERLQGLPDNWTLLDDKTCSDSARYKAIGNGMAQPCADFVIKRIMDVVNKNEQQ